jgi:hypothetical protein
MSTIQNMKLMIQLSSAGEGAAMDNGKQISSPASG